MVSKDVDLDAETEKLGGSSSEDESGSSDGIPDHFFGVVDEPAIEDASEVGYSTEMWIKNIR